MNELFPRRRLGYPFYLDFNENGKYILYVFNCLFLNEECLLVFVPENKMYF